MPPKYTQERPHLQAVSGLGGAALDMPSAVAKVVKLQLLRYLQINGREAARGTDRQTGTDMQRGQTETERQT